MSKHIKRSRHRKADIVIEQGEAASAVLGLPELLEMILLAVDTKTLLLSQRVDKTFRNVIAGSQELQVRLGFQAPSQKLDSNTGLPKCRISSLLNKPINMGRYGFLITTFPGSTDGILHVTIEKNMRKSLSATRICSGKAANYEHASWRRMLIVGGSGYLRFLCVAWHNRKRCAERMYAIVGGRNEQTMGQVHNNFGKVVLPVMGLEACKVFCEAEEAGFDRHKESDIQWLR
ncbi:hypothetical protein LTR56_012735 [Elasticomyces elasticus]|nr:hypothetical protein LTR22_022980 [Elasticomyces elasticus]KAK3639012.1 hypothetical protein LTR56_012735 [Elasticomyces elasticus]KAK4918734.1 hypothetical protein LTR49_013521 [Elasticomyces elasticus]KAK5754437.1 hypothetical protein LTS12_015506 [Elasticomyces elasticus]